MKAKILISKGLVIHRQVKINDKKEQRFNVTENAKIKQSVLSNFLFVSFSLEYGEKQCASGFWNGELEAELRELGNLDFLD